MKICLVGGELFHVDGQTDTTKLTVAFWNFANAPKNCSSSTSSQTLVNIIINKICGSRLVQFSNTGTLHLFVNLEKSPP